MDIIATVIAAIVGAASATIVAWVNSRATARKSEAEADSVDIAAIRGIAEAARSYVAELQERVTKLEAVLDEERKTRRNLEAEFDKLNRKFAALCQWVRGQGLDVNGFLAGLE